VPDLAVFADDGRPFDHRAGSTTVPSPMSTRSPMLAREIAWAICLATQAR